MRILVVDDDPRQREVAVRILQREGHEVAAAESGEAAVGRLNGDLDLVLTDLNMPGSVNGLELTRRVRAASSTDVIIMTGFPDLQTAIQALRDGAYDYIPKPFGADELKFAVQRCDDKRRLSAELAREKELRAELDRAYRDLKEMQRVREIFGQFATPEVAKLVLSHPDDFRRRGERRTVTVLFADVRSFTTYAEKVPPETAVAALNGLVRAVVEAVRAEGGMVNKFIGDGVMALFGAPVERPDHAPAAARAALRASAEAAALGRARRGDGAVPLQLGIAVNTGEVVAGCLGTDERTEYSVIGHAVNVAAKLEKEVPPGGILLGPATVAALGPEFELGAPRPASLPGVAEPVAVRPLLGLRRPAGT